MKIAVYNEQADNVAGGAEYVVATIAEALSDDHDVDILHHKARLTTEALTLAYATDMSRVTLRYIPRIPSTSFWSNTVRRDTAERNKYASVDRQYDLMIASVHNVPPFCSASRGALFVHFPSFDRDRTWPWINDGRSPRKILRRAYARCEWRRRFGGYQVVMANSGFTRDYVSQWWHLNAEVVFAPGGSLLPTSTQHPKAPLILSVGRYASGRRSKNQVEMMGAFAELKMRKAAADWLYTSVGALGDNADDVAYFRLAEAAAVGLPTSVLADASRQTVSSLYHDADIFWHAAGLTANGNPAMMEHFGIVTVEAMAAGCIPVVLSYGGQREIVEHGVSGFLCSTLAEMVEYTFLLVADSSLRAQMRLAAQQRAQLFSKDAFVQRVLRVLAPVLR